MITDVSADDFNVAVGGQVEIIGWLYQYYNTEPKDQAFKKKKYLESDIPAVTQLFTPDWIVKYMVENSLGRYWIDVLQAKGDRRSDKEIANDFEWHYFMPAAQQTDQVTVQSNGVSLADEQIEQVTLIDAAMGSGHILIYAFEIFMQIYEREGYSRRDAAKSIIQNNLYGLDIDTRAFQLAYFSLMMKARETNRRFLTLHIRPQVFDIPETGILTSSDFQELLKNEDEAKSLDYLLDKFRYGNEYGSLIQFEKPVDWLLIDRLVNADIPAGQLSLNTILLAENQAKLSEIAAVGKVLSKKFTVGAMNPPYMGSGKMDANLGKYVKRHFPNSKSDLFAVFMERLRAMTCTDGYYAMITQHAWMFLSSFEKLREVLKEDTLINMAHLGTRAFEEIGGEVVQSTTFVFKVHSVPNYIGTYERLVNFDSQQKKQEAYLRAVKDNQVDYLYRTNQANFAKIPGMPIAYWASDNLFRLFNNDVELSSKFRGKEGLGTGDNARFLRQWFELSEMQKGWYPYQKGGSYRKWYGNNEYYVNWKNNGLEMKSLPKSNIRNMEYQNRTGITWSAISSGKPSFRYSVQNFFFDSKGPMMFGLDAYPFQLVLGLLNSKVAEFILSFLSPTLDYRLGQIQKIPLLPVKESAMSVSKLVDSSIEYSKNDWDSFETSWDFTHHPLLSHIADDNLSHCRSPVG
ncbi:BREX-1 system adenine-specific DNA-methyltransferase PglX [Levilactobacillus wangkuiensis]|uniref:BREX-1 system adenine-specific DNA-methyltransferase PglX n=1 Tax=Levilactobacillus wangkuiensis TaxID=2799566 RepID=UPI00194102F4|nr:BREX-1 system adenine-specific DNA-methyltransferase PglX [Levilactobacillus wangkuiensis]